MYDTIRPSGEAPILPYGLAKITIGGVEFTKEELAPEVWHAANRALALEQLAKDIEELRADPAPTEEEIEKQAAEYARAKYGGEP